MVDFGYCIIFIDCLGKFSHTFFGRPVVGGSEAEHFKISEDKIVSFMFSNAHPDCSFVTLFPLTYLQYQELFS
jgi:hypothetical protein